MKPAQQPLVRAKQTVELANGVVRERKLATCLTLVAKLVVNARLDDGISVLMKRQCERCAIRLPPLVYGTWATEKQLIVAQLRPEKNQDSAKKHRVEPPRLND